MTNHRAIHHKVDRALKSLSNFTPIVLIDDCTNETTGYLVVPAQAASATTVAFIVRHSSGFLLVALPETECERLGLTEMDGVELGERSGLAACVTVDAATGISTGISAQDRALTAALLADPATDRTDLTRPGHVVPVRVARDSLIAHQGPAEAAAYLSDRAGRRPAAILAAMVSERRIAGLASIEELTEFARLHRLAMVSVRDVTNYLLGTEPLTQPGLTINLDGSEMVTYSEIHSQIQHVAAVTGPVHESHEAVLHVRRDSTSNGIDYLSDESRYAESATELLGAGIAIHLDSGLDVAPHGSSSRVTRSTLLPHLAASITETTGVRSVYLINNEPELTRALQMRGIQVRPSDARNPTENAALSSSSRPYQALR